MLDITPLTKTNFSEAVRLVQKKNTVTSIEMITVHHQHTTGQTTVTTTVRVSNVLIVAEMVTTPEIAIHHQLDAQGDQQAVSRIIRQIRKITIR